MNFVQIEAYLPDSSVDWETWTQMHCTEPHREDILFAFLSTVGTVYILGESYRLLWGGRTVPAPLFLEKPRNRATIGRSNALPQMLGA